MIKTKKHNKTRIYKKILQEAADKWKRFKQATVRITWAVLVDPFRRLTPLFFMEARRHTEIRTHQRCGDALGARG